MTLLQRQGAQHTMPTNLFSSFWHILSHTGPAGLFKGYWATNCVWLPWNIVYISCYEANKRAAQAWLQVPDGHPIPAAAIMACAFTAATVGAVATHPADVIKTRLQVCTSPLDMSVHCVGMLCVR